MFFPRSGNLTGGRRPLGVLGVFGVFATLFRFRFTAGGVRGVDARDVCWTGKRGFVGVRGKMFEARGERDNMDCRLRHVCMMFSRRDGVDGRRGDWGAHWIALGRRTGMVAVDGSVASVGASA